MDKSALLKEIEFYSSIIDKCHKYDTKNNSTACAHVNPYQFDKSKSNYHVTTNAVRNNPYVFIKNGRQSTTSTPQCSKKPTKRAQEQLAPSIKPHPKCKSHRNKVWIRNRKLIPASTVTATETTLSPKKQNWKSTRKISITSNPVVKWKSWMHVPPSSTFKPRTKVQKQLSPKLPKCNQFRKINIACPTFKKYGKCKLNDKNRCKFSHNANNVNICRRFLVGACDIINCNLSHQVTMENVPTCKFFLRNMCVTENCPYLHIKVDSNANLCPDFLNGFCKAGEKCLKRHEEPKPFQKHQKSHSNNKYPTQQPLQANVLVVNLCDDSDNKCDKNIRYYLKDENGDNNDNGDNNKSNSNSNSDDNNQKMIPERVSIGPLDSFIPFN